MCEHRAFFLEFADSIDRYAENLKCDVTESAQSP
jgi:hypothetical protein